MNAVPIVHVELAADTKEIGDRPPARWPRAPALSEAAVVAQAPDLGPSPDHEPAAATVGNRPADRRVPLEDLARAQ
jgi:hypothetical protein